MPAKTSCANSTSPASAHAEDLALQCPLCGQPNQCAQQAGQAFTACWCMQRPVLGRDWLAQRLPRLSDAERRCLCPACHEWLVREKANQ